MTINHLDPSTILEFRRIEQLEKTFKEHAAEYIKKYGGWHLFGELMLTGSFGQGSFSASMLSRKCNIFNENGLCMEFDFDIQLPLEQGILNTSCLEDVKGKLGIVSVKTICSKAFVVADPYYNRVWSTNNTYLQHYYIKEMILKKLSRQENENIRNTEVIIKTIFQDQKKYNFNNFEIKPRNRVSKATSQKIYNFFFDQTLYARLNIDIAFAFEAKLSPPVLKDFNKRTSYALPASVRNHIYLVAKSSQEEKYNKNSTEWSYSFTHIENSIFNDIYTDTENLIYLISKSAFKKHIQHMDDGDVLKSYLLKSTVFWYFEAMGRRVRLKESDWFDEAIVLFHTQKIFKKMQIYLEKGFLPSYFIPELNLIKGVNKYLLDKVIHQIERKVLGSTSLDDLFTVKELKDLQIRLNSIKDTLLYGKENYKSAVFVSSMIKDNKSPKRFTTLLIGRVLVIIFLFVICYCLTLYFFFA